ncbi:MAG: hypothetical protein J6Q55_00495 [Clostridia bacterium]|nr:hypothetical protein [Clostridia bacterium]
MKKYLAIVLAVLMALTCVALVACEKPCEHNFQNGTCTLCGEADPNAGRGANIHQDEEFTGSAIVGSGKVYLKTLGQADWDYAQTLVTDSQYGAGYTNATVNNLLEASEVEAGSTVIVVVGYTAKGIAPGITIAGETARAQAFAAKAGEINLIVMHLGGVGRRGEASDPMIEAIVAVADYTFVYHDATVASTGGDYDGLFSNTATTELYLYADETEIVPALKVLLGL